MTTQQIQALLGEAKRPAAVQLLKNLMCQGTNQFTQP